MKIFLYFIFLMFGLNFFTLVHGSDDDAIVHNTVAGGRETLPCQYRSSDGTTSGTTVYWFRKTTKTTVIATGTTVLKDKAKFEISKPAVDEWNLIIKHVEPSDEASYTCKVMEHGKLVKVTSRKLSVHTKPEINDRKSSPSTTTAQEFETITIWCNVSGKPTPNVTWQRRLGQINNRADIGVKGNELKILHIPRYATDTYICTATNPYGSVSKDIHVKVKFPVNAMVYQEEITAGLGEKVEMFCLVEGEPIIDAYWKNVNGNRIKTSDWHFNITTEDVPGFPMKQLTLTILKNALSKMDYGNYTCVAAGDISVHKTVLLTRANSTADKADYN